MSRVDDKLVIAYTENRESVWVRADSDVGDTIISPDKTHKFMVVRVDRYATREPDILLRRLIENSGLQSEGIIQAMDLEINDEIYVNNGWAKVTGLNKTQGRWYIYVDCVCLTSGLKMPSQRIPKTNKIKIKSRRIVMSVTLLNCHDLVKSVQAKLIDYHALVDAPERVEVAPSVFVDKEPILSALKASVKAEYNKLGEQLKKL